MKQNRSLRRGLAFALLLLGLSGCKPGKDLLTMEIITEEGRKEVPMVTMMTDVI